ncbi:MAG TPA: cation-translocating P-type ATPase [Steroidobacteraceae bacterium]|nr:cation-translocating P-type ATPase [Steroidobacteraceae bacterium]
MSTETTAVPWSRSVFNVHGMHCSNCARTVERAVRELDGVRQFTLNPATAVAAIDWDPRKLSLTRVFNAIRTAGFRAAPLEGDQVEADARAERRSALKRIGIAGLGMMQTMMLIYALYAGGAHGVDPQIARYLRLTGMLLATPVLFYSGMPFLTAAARDLRRHRIGMDVPVSAALLLAYGASVVNTLRGSGAVYYDSVTMFVFLLSVGRFAEMVVRQRSITSREAFTRSVPSTAVRITPAGGTERVAVGELRAGDIVSVARGAVVPVDGRLVSARGWLDESLVTGESVPVPKSDGAPVFGGSVNTQQPIQVECSASADQSAIAGIAALLQRAAAQRPRTLAIADRVSSLFSCVTLILAGAVAVFWLWSDPANAMPATLAVLVVTCPCALSLAVPATFAATTSRLARVGLLVVKADSLERLAKVNTVILDKTGTLTEGKPVARVAQLRDGLSAEKVMAIAAALERASDHPLSEGFAPYAHPDLVAEHVVEEPGQGLEGTVAGEAWRLGRPEFIARMRIADPTTAAGRSHPAASDDGWSATSSRLVLGRAGQEVARFQVEQNLAASARGAVADLQARGLRVAIVSGDSEEAVGQVAAMLGVSEHHARVDFSRKPEIVKQCQAAGANVLMVGDGINDGPALATADVSCAMAQGSAIAQCTADLLLMPGSLSALGRGIELAHRAGRVMRQNLAWAFIYNVTAVPLAAAGYIAPWVAALGMSLSSLAVVMNAARLAADRPARTVEHAV